VLGLELTVQVGVNPEPHVQFFTYSLPEGVERTGHDLQVLVRGAGGPPAPGVRFLNLASEPPAEAGHFEMVLDDGLPGRGILETGVAFRRAAGDAHEIDANFEDAAHQPLGVIRVIQSVRTAKRGAEDLHVTKAHFTAFAHAFERVSLPTTPGICRIPDAVLLLLNVDRQLPHRLVRTCWRLSGRRVRGRSDARRQKRSGTG